MDRKDQISRIIIRNRVEAVEPVIEYLRCVAAQAGLNTKESHRICYGVEETLQNSILFDFEPDETEEIEIEISRIPAGLKVVISDQGIPRNPFVKQPRSLEEIEADISFDQVTGNDGDQISAVSSFVLHKLLDRCTSVNLGKDGRSLEMVIYASESRISQESARDNERHREQPGKFSLIRPARTADTMGISRLFYKSYGYSYVNDIVYYPERLNSAVDSTMLRSTVALSDLGEVIGHITLMDPYENSQVTEWGMAISDPDFRGQGVMSRLVEEMMADSSLASYQGMFAHSVTNHEFTQKICLAHGFSDVALLVGFAGADLSFKKIHSRLKQRESTIISYKALGSRDRARLFLPPHHRKMITELYGGIGVDIQENSEGAMDVPVSGTKLTHTIIPSINIAEIVLRQVGEDIGELIGNTTRKLCLARVDILYLIIDLEDPRAVAAVEACEETGYIFAGIFPGYHHDHSLMMQYFNNLQFDFSLITGYSPMAQSLKEYIGRCADIG